MTSPSRRKHRTTARPTAPIANVLFERRREAPIARSTRSAAPPFIWRIMVSCGVLVALGSGLARGETPRATGHGAQLSQRGAVVSPDAMATMPIERRSRVALRWLPPKAIRTQSLSAAPREPASAQQPSSSVEHVGFTAETQRQPQKSVRPVAALDAGERASVLNDPFGDRSQPHVTTSTPPQPEIAPPRSRIEPAPPMIKATAKRRAEPMIATALQFSPDGDNAGEPIVADPDCAGAADLKAISEIDWRIHPTDDGVFPKGCPLVATEYQPRSWPIQRVHWTASALCHKPLYFEDVQLERYGHSWGPITQPFVSGAKFFLTVPILPYKMGVHPPRECIYTLGHYRVGSCAPYLIDPFPLSVRGALFEAGVWAGAPFFIP